MKKIILIVALFPWTVFANEGTNPNFHLIANNKCEDIIDPDERKNCLVIAKQNEAQENYKNFQENNHGQDQEEF